MTHIGGWGFSLGGEILLGALADLPALRGVIADGATYRTLDDFFTLPLQRTNLFLPQVWLMYQWVRLLSGQTPPPRMLDAMLAAPDVPLLLIAGENEPLEEPYNTLFAGEVGDRATVWVVPNAGHTQGFAIAQDEYEQRVLDFFATVLAE